MSKQAYLPGYKLLTFAIDAEPLRAAFSSDGEAMTACLRDMAKNKFGLGKDDFDNSSWDPECIARQDRNTGAWTVQLLVTDAAASRVAGQPGFVSAVAPEPPPQRTFGALPPSPDWIGKTAAELANMKKGQKP